MFVGGLGRDLVRLHNEGRRDVVRLRGGGADEVRCYFPGDPRDIFVVDGSDRVGRACKGRVMLTERARYPYP